VTAIFVGHLVTRARAPVSEGVVPLRIQTEPPRVQVWLDGQPRGVSPLVAESLAPGSHRVRVVAEGYAPAELTLDLARGTTPAPLRFVMVPVGAPLRVDSEPAGAIVRLGDRRVGETPLVLIVAPGAHVVRVEHKGFRPHVSRLDARAGQPLQVVARLESLTRERAPEGRDAGVAQAAPTDTAARTERPAASVTPPRLVAGDSPAYPEAARRMKLSGSVLVEMTVTEKGEPKDVRILESAGAILDEAVLGPLRHWRFQPARQDGVAVPVRWRYRHTFS
jgi:TonB family protein